MTLENVKAEIELGFEDLREAEIVFKSLELEIADSPSQRTETSFKLNNNTLKLEINATDATSLRAAVNSYLRWIRLSHDIVKLK